MTTHIPASRLHEQAQIVPAPARRNHGERAFDLHPAVHALTAGAYLAFVVILGAAFMGPDLVVPAGIILVSVFALFVTPGLWARVVPGDGLRRQSWHEFLSEGVECLTGKLSAGQALAQILTLPALIVGLALAIAAIKAFAV